MCTDERVARNLKLYWGVSPVLARKVGTTERVIGEAEEAAKKLGLARRGARIVVTSGTAGLKGSTDLVKVITIA